VKRKTGKFIIIAVLFCCLTNSNSLAQENVKLAQSGFKFLSVVSDARASAMAEAMTSLSVGSSSLFFNPAGMARMEEFVDVSASINSWIADINHYTFSLAINPAQGRYGVIGFSLQSVKYGDFYGTRVSNGTVQGYEETQIFTVSALAVGVGYAKQLTDRFSVGGHVRWVRQDLGTSVIPVVSGTRTVIVGADTLTVPDTIATPVSNVLSPLVFDFGTQFKTGFKSLVFGMSVRNFSSQMQYAQEGFQAPLTFTLGISMDLMDFVEQPSMDQSLYLSIDASHYRDYPEQIKIGMDYKILKIFSLRGGYITNSDQSGWSYGLGISKLGFAFDYSYTPFKEFVKVQRVTIRYSL
jgi:hypothetical protein